MTRVSPELAASLPSFERVSALLEQQRRQPQPQVDLAFSPEAPQEAHVINASAVEYHSVPARKAKADVAKIDTALVATDILGEAPLTSTPESKNDRRFQRLIAVGVVVAGLVLGGGLVSRKGEAVETRVISNSTPVEGLNLPESKVDSSYTFFADQAPAGSNHFGPAGQSENLDVSVGDQVYRISEDPADMVATSEFLDHLNTDSPESRDQKIVDYINNTAEWSEKFAEITKYLDSGQVSFVVKSGDYHTMYMVPGTNGERPGIYQSVESMSDKVLLKYDIPQADGTMKTYLFKVECGFQPVQFDAFIGIPKLPKKPRTTTTTTQPPTTTTTRPIKTDRPNPGPHPQPGDPNGPEPSGDPSLDDPKTGYQPGSPQPAPLPPYTSPPNTQPRPPATEPAPRPPAAPTPVTTAPGTGNGPSGGSQPTMPSN